MYIVLLIDFLTFTTIIKSTAEDLFSYLFRPLLCIAPDRWLMILFSMDQKKMNAMLKRSNVSLQVPSKQASVLGLHTK